MENEWLNNEVRDWLREAPDRELGKNMNLISDKKSNESLEDFLRGKNSKDVTEEYDFLAISGIMKNKQLIGKKTGKPIDLNEKKSMFYSRPGLYIIKQQNPTDLKRWSQDRTHYVGEGKNLAQRLSNRGGHRAKIFADGSEVTIIIKGTGTINQDQFFIHEVRTTCERMISDLIEEKWPEKAACCNKPSWCVIHEAGVEQVGKLELFVRHLLKNKIISPP